MKKSVILTFLNKETFQNIRGGNPLKEGLSAIALKTDQKVVYTLHLLAGAVQELVRTKFSR